MLDSDLAELYGYEVKKLNQQVKRNLKRFPEDFMFQLSREEVDLVKSQIVTSPNQNIFEGQDGGRRKLPYAFTEQGIYACYSFARRISGTAKYLYYACFSRIAPYNKTKSTIYIEYGTKCG